MLNRRFVGIQISLFSLLLGFIIFKSQVKATWFVDSEGRLIFMKHGVVLSQGSDQEDDNDDEDKSGSSSGSDNSDSDSSGTGSGDDEDSSGSGNGENGDHDQEEIKFETIDPITGIKTKTEVKDGESRTEVIFGDGEKVKTRTKEGETRTDVYSGGVKVRLERKDDRVVIKAENDQGDEVEVGDDEIVKIEERLDKSTIKVATGSGNRMLFARGGFGALLNFPLSVDLETNELAVDTPAGTKNVTVLPDQAVTNMLAANVIDRLGPQALAEATLSANLGNVSGIVSMTEENGTLVYEINGISEQKLLGFIPVEIAKTAIVSAETGELIKTRKDFINQITDAISF